MIRIHLLVYQPFFVSFMSSIVQFTFIVSISICPCIKINADAVGLHITQVFTKPGNCYFYGANCVVYEAFPFKCFLRPKLQIATLVCDTDVFEMEIINTLNETLLLLMMLRIMENVVSDISLSVVLDLNFFLRPFFLFCRKCLKGKRCTNPRQCLWFT